MKKITVLGLTTGFLAACLATAPLNAGPAAAGPASREGARFDVTAKVSKTEPMQGDKVKIRGEVEPARPGEVVKLQRRYGTSGKWKTAKETDVLNQNGKFKFVDKVSSVRFRQYRVVKPASGNHRTGKSQKLGVTVYGWRNLTSLRSVTSDRMLESGSVTINAVDHRASLMAYTTEDEGSIVYNINRGCKTLEATYGLEDSSEATATGTVELEADSVSKYNGEFMLAESQFARHDMTGVFRITFRWTSTNTAGTPEDQSGAHVAVGSPRLLCNF